MELSQKERLMLEDQQKDEAACIKKYQEFANKTQEPQLKQMFNEHAVAEQQHYDTLQQILDGQVPDLAQNEQGQQQEQPKTFQSGPYNENDYRLCSDLLMTEKFVSANYDTAIFECQDSKIREDLNHIQKEEQKHGEEIFHYMQCHDMYKVQ